MGRYESTMSAQQKKTFEDGSESVRSNLKEGAQQQFSVRSLGEGRSLYGIAGDVP